MACEDVCHWQEFVVVPNLQPELLVPTSNPDWVNGCPTVR
jgi:hypothetical protein